MELCMTISNGILYAMAGLMGCVVALFALMEWNS